jgi:hypothetical protein
VALLIEDIDQNYKGFVLLTQNLACSAIAMDTQNHWKVAASSWSVEGMVPERLEVSSAASAALTAESAAEIELPDFA